MTVRIPLATLVAMAIASTASAKVCVWTGAGTPSAAASDNLLWSDADNWEGGNVPAKGDTVVFTEQNKTTHRLNMALELENLYYTNSLGTTFNSSKSLTLTGTDSVVALTKAATFWVPIQLPAGSKLSIDNSDSLSLKATTSQFAGEGEIMKTGSGDLNIYARSTSFSGTLRVSQGEVKIMASVVNPLGSNSVVHTHGGINIRCPVTLNNRLYLHDCHLISYCTTVVNGDITLVAESTTASSAFRVFNIEGVQDSKYSQASSPPGFIINGDISLDNTLYPCRIYYYSYGASAATCNTNCFFEINGHVDYGAYQILAYHKQDGDRCKIYVNSPFTSTGSAVFSLSQGDIVCCGAKNVLGSGRDVSFGAANKNLSDMVLDLCGYDQTIRRLMFMQSDGYTTSASITSTKGPATLSTTTIYAGSDHHTVVNLDGEVSLSLNKGETTTTHNLLFKGGNTTGWIISDYSPCDLTAAAFPNLGGISLKGAGVARVSSTTALKSGVKLDFNSRSTGYLRLDSDVAITAAQVVDGGIDLAPGKYCRTGAGVENATEVDWLGGGEGYNGTVTIQEHTPSLIWTGAGDCTLSDAGNWGVNESPDLTDTTLTLDFRYATAENPILLSGTVAPACAMTSGDVSQGSPAFGGSGTLVLSGSAVETNNFSFTGGASLTYSGTGTLVLRCSDSDTTGTLTVSSGKVVLDGSSWLGSVVVASGAELEVLSSCGSGVFSPAEGENRCGIVLNGKLTLGKGVSAMAGRIEVAGSPLRAKRTYGSSSSPASSVDDVHFGGEGVISVEYKPMGLVIICK